MDAIALVNSLTAAKRSSKSRVTVLRSNPHLAAHITVHPARARDRFAAVKEFTRAIASIESEDSHKVPYRSRSYSSEAMIDCITCKSVWRP